MNCFTIKKYKYCSKVNEQMQNSVFQDFITLDCMLYDDDVVKEPKALLVHLKIK